MASARVQRHPPIAASSSSAKRDITRARARGDGEVQEAGCCTLHSEGLVKICNHNPFQTEIGKLVPPVQSHKDFVTEDSGPKPCCRNPRGAVHPIQGAEKSRAAPPTA